MAMQQAATSAQETATVESLREQMRTVQISLDDALARRAGVIARIDAAGGPGERVSLRNGELRGVDGQITRYKQELAGLAAELQAREASLVNTPTPPAAAPPPPPPVAVNALPAPAAVPTTTSTAVPPVGGVDLTSMALGGVAATLLLLPIIVVMAWRAGRRAARGEGGSQLERLEDAIAAIQVDVERVSESQRFLTSALVSDPLHVPTREEVGTRR